MPDRRPRPTAHGPARLALFAIVFAGCGRVGFDPPDATGGLDGAPRVDGGGSDGPVAHVCGDGRVEGGEVCDDGNAMDGDECSADCAERVVCGDGVVSGTESCDDANSVPADGCENDCTPSCATSTDCDDGAPCNGAETCAVEQVCMEGMPLVDGTPCEVTNICRAGACAPISCGDGILDPGEECDDRNTVNGDGCDNDCTRSCVLDADCDDADACNGAETCDSENVCHAGTAALIGTVCDRDAMPSTRDICRDGGCFHSVCGDGFTDPGRMPPERCDDGNTTDGDGCDNDCAYSCVMSAMCDDGELCNGVEGCDTVEHRCVSGMLAADGTLCPGGMCNDGACIAVARDGGAPLDGGGMCMPLTMDPSAIGRACIKDCPPGYTCHPFSGAVISYTCEVLCEIDCDCPPGTRCVTMMDKAGSFQVCA